MRSILLLTAALALVAWFVIRQLPSGDADAAPVVATSQQVQSISIAGGPSLPVAAMRAAMSTKVGSMVDDSKLEEDRVTLEASLAARGYLSARVAAPVVTFGGGGAYVVFDVERGPLYHLRSVELHGAGWSDAGVVTLAAGDEAIGDRLSRARQAAEETLARHGKQALVELVVHPDPTTAMVDVELITRP